MSWLKEGVKQAQALANVVDCKVRGAGRKKIALHIPPRRILLLNAAHLGDVVISTSVIPILRSAYPGAEIGFVVGSWAQAVVMGHPAIQYVHCVDHWRKNRIDSNFWTKWRRYRKSSAIALAEIREVGYDVALCLSTVFPDLLELAWAAEIPERVGFRPSRSAPYATRLVDLPQGAFLTEGSRQVEVLKAFPIGEDHLALRKSMLAPSDAAAWDEVERLLAPLGDAKVAYRVVHVGSGARFKEMPWQFWREVAEKLSGSHLLIFTGHGEHEAEMIEAILAGIPNAVNACGKLSWNGFVAAVRGAEFLYGVDSVAGHVAAAVGTPCAVLSAGANLVGRWRPDGERVTVFSNPMPCSPCHLPNGCAEMSCLHAATPETLVSLG